MTPFQQTGTNQSPPSNAELRDQIRQTVRDAQEAARQAAQEAAAAQGGGRIVFSPPAPPSPPGGGFTIQRGPFDPVIPRQVVDISIGFFVMCAVMVIGWPIARAFGKRIERRAAEPAALNPQMADQLKRIEQAVDAMSVEIERISESQRFMAKLQSGSPPGDVRR